MLIQERDDLKIEASHNFKKSDFTIKASAQAFQILSSGLYQDKVKAVIREVSCNAVDGHIAAEKGLKNADGSWLVLPKLNQTQVPFDVSLPTSMNPVFKVRDYGIGLSEEAVFNIYTTYFGSTKSNSNDEIGGFGLGSKSPFSISTTFGVTSFFNGVKTVYTAMINEEGFPTIVKMNSTTTSEPNGVLVEVPVKNSDIELFEERAQQVYQYFDVKPKIVAGARYGLNMNKLFTIVSKHPRYWNVKRQYNVQNPVIVQGQVEYQLNFDALAGHMTDEYLQYYKQIFNSIIIVAPIGVVKPAANRESLSYTKETINYIKSVIEELAADDIKQVEDDYSKVNDIFSFNTFATKYANSSYYNKTREAVSFALAVTKTGKEFKYRNFSIHNLRNNTIPIPITIEVPYTEQDTGLKDEFNKAIIRKIPSWKLSIRHGTNLELVSSGYISYDEKKKVLVYIYYISLNSILNNGIFYLNDEKNNVTLMRQEGVPANICVYTSNEEPFFFKVLENLGISPTTYPTKFRKISDLKLERPVKEKNARPKTYRLFTAKKDYSSAANHLYSTESINGPSKELTEGYIICTDGGPFNLKLKTHSNGDVNITHSWITYLNHIKVIDQKEFMVIPLSQMDKIKDLYPKAKFLHEIDLAWTKLSSDTKKIIGLAYQKKTQYNNKNRNEISSAIASLDNFVKKCLPTDKEANNLLRYLQNGNAAISSVFSHEHDKVIKDNVYTEKQLLSIKDTQLDLNDILNKLASSVPLIEVVKAVSNNYNEEVRKNSYAAITPYVIQEFNKFKLNNIDIIKEINK